MIVGNDQEGDDSVIIAHVSTPYKSLNNILTFKYFGVSYG